MIYVLLVLALGGLYNSSPAVTTQEFVGMAACLKAADAYEALGQVKAVCVPKRPLMSDHDE